MQRLHIRVIARLLCLLVATALLVTFLPRLSSVAAQGVDAVDDFYTVCANSDNFQPWNANDSAVFNVIAYDTSTSAGGSISLGDDGSWQNLYIPVFGIATFTYTVSDGVSQDTATVTLDVVPNTATTTPDNYTAVSGETLSGVNVFSNDSGDGLVILGYSYSASVGGIDTAAFNLQPDGSLTYTPPDGFTGVVNYSYLARDDYGCRVEQANTIVVGATPNQPPIITSVLAAENPIILPNRSTTLTVNTSDPDGDALTYSWNNPFLPEDLTIQSPNAASTLITFADLISGAEGNFTVTVSDGRGGVASAEIIIRLEAAPTPTDTTAPPTATPTPTNTPVPPTATATNTPAPPTATPTVTNTPTPIGCTFQTQIPQDECNALVNLYSSTNGAGWFNRAGWLATNAPCSWYGVTCVGGHVTRLSLESNRLSGVLPALPGQLDYLMLGSNNLTGAIPPLPTSLRFVYLYGNRLSGSIPELPTAVQEVFLMNNQLTGSLPSFPSTLIRFAAAFNGLTGTIPSLPPSMYYLWLSNNGLSGTIPAFPSTMGVVNLADNQLTGSIPPLPPPMIHLKLFNNRLSGEVPLSILTTGIQVFTNEYGDSLRICGTGNDLYSNNAAVNAFITARMPGWAANGNRCFPVTSTPTNTPVPPTATATDTPTNTPVPPTATPTDTPVPPTSTPTSTLTNTPTNTPVLPTATPTATATNTPPPTGTLQASLTLQGRGAPSTAMSVQLTVELYVPGGTTPAAIYTPTTDVLGAFSIGSVTPGTYVVWVKAQTAYLSERAANVVITGGTATTAAFAPLRAGDANGDDSVDLADLGLLARAYDAGLGQPAYNARADFNADGFVDLADLGLLARNYDTGGAPRSGQ